MGFFLVRRVYSDRNGVLCHLQNVCFTDSCQFVRALVTKGAVLPCGEISPIDRREPELQPTTVVQQ